jgi:hypothetical protein
MAVIWAEYQPASMFLFLAISAAVTLMMGNVISFWVNYVIVELAKHFYSVLLYEPFALPLLAES